MTGLVVNGTGFEVLAGDERIGPRRRIGSEDTALLIGLANRYVHAVQARADDSVFVGLGRDLYAWLNGDQGQLSALLDRAAHPLVFEVQGPRSPSEGAWAVLGAPFELLAPPGSGLLAEDELARFSVVRRLGPPAEDRPGLDEFRLGLAFMASAPRGQRELDFEAEEAAILTAVGETRIDLLVEDTGDPEQLAHRLAEVGGMPVVHLSCHGLNNWPAKSGGPGMPVLMMETEVGEDRPATAAELASLLPGGVRLLFVSACLTATGADAAGHLPPAGGHKADPGPGAGGGLVAHSLATALVTAGMPAVVGWDGSVGDRAATLFAQRLYDKLADRADLAVAVGDARRTLLGSEDRAVRADWHLARLWLGPAGGGRLIAGSRPRSTSGTFRLSTVPRMPGRPSSGTAAQAITAAVSKRASGRKPQLTAIALRPSMAPARAPPTVPENSSDRPVFGPALIPLITRSGGSPKAPTQAARTARPGGPSTPTAGTDGAAGKIRSVTVTGVPS